MAKAKPATMRREREGAATPARLQEARERAARRRAAAMAFLCYVIVLALLAPGYYLQPYPTKVGDVPDGDIVTKLELRVKDPDTNAQRKRAIEENGSEIWAIDVDRDSLARQKLNAFIDLLNQSELQNNRQLNGFVKNVQDQLGIALDPATVSELMPARLRVLAPPLTLDYLQSQLWLIIDDILNDQHVVHNLALYQVHLASKRMLLRDRLGLEHKDKPDSGKVLVWPEGVEDYLRKQALPRYLPGEERQPLREAAADLIVQLIGGPNITYSSTLTRENRQRQLEDLAQHPVYKTYQPGDVVAEAGKPLGPLQAEALGQLNEKRRAMILTKLVGIMLLAAIVLAAMALYLVRFRSGFHDDATGVLLYALPVMLALAVGQGAQALLKDPTLVKLCFPAALVGLLSSLVINPRAGFVLVLVSACLFGIVNGQGIDFLMLALFGGFTTVLTSRRLRERADMIQVAWKVGAVNMLVVAIFTFVDGNWRLNPQYLGIVFCNALVCVGATYFILWFIERFFGVVTDFKLLELTGLHHPLITQLEEKAPGSYQHVLNMTKLAEAAANAIGANYLLVRAGALFHDIGKMVKPKYFSENQVTLDDKKAHSKLSPYMSVLIIKNHVKEGIELGKRMGLPQKIVDFIPQHHGTGLIRFFYSTAQKRYEESATAEPVREEDFRYPGPKPQSIEAAIVLLADSVEAIAASRFTGSQVSEDEIRRVTQTAISERFDDGQFDECDLTMRHLRDMREAFVRTLLARYHFRVAYPALPKPSVPRTETTSSSITVVGPPTRGEAAG
jgi:putative nucleotidyltransferase with HDIG domain